MTAGVGIQPDQATGALGGVTRRLKVPPAVMAIYVVWFFVLFEPEWLIASYGAGPLRKIGSFLWLVVFLIALGRGRLRYWYWPLGLLVLIHAAPVAVVENRGRLFDTFKLILYYYIIVVASLATINTVRRALPLVTLFLFQFAWWMLHGLPHYRILPRVTWEPFLSNDDGFAVLACLGVGFAYYAVQAFRTPRMRWAALATAGLCVIGVVAAFARGALIACGFVLAVIVLRSPRRGRAMLSVGGILVVVLVTQSVLFPQGAFWNELASSTSHGVTEGTNKDRWDLWRAAYRVFETHPFAGAGAGNFGPVAAKTLKWGEIAGQYSDPSRIWGRVTHNVYMQILSELGSVGMFAFLAVIVDFFRRNASLRRPAALERWYHEGGQYVDLRYLSLGLEGMMVAFLASGLFYDQLYIQWFFLLTALNLILWQVAARPRPAVLVPGWRPSGSHGVAAVSASSSSTRMTPIFGSLS